MNTYFILIISLLILIIIIFCVKDKDSLDNKDIENSMVIHCRAGLCNRLRTIFSYYRLAQKENKKLVVIWNKNRECPGHFNDYFVPIKDISFTNNNKLKVYYKGWDPHPDYSPDYNLLKLNPHMLNIINQKRKKLDNKYNAVHIRRTDAVKYAKINNSYTDDNQFIDFINKNSDKNLYIATDTKKTYNQFKNKFENLVKLPYHKTLYGLRKTTLKDSIIDLYMCIYADKFKGSGYSSFSDFILEIRKNDIFN